MLTVWLYYTNLFTTFTYSCKSKNSPDWKNKKKKILLERIIIPIKLLRLIQSLLISILVKSKIKSSWKIHQTSF